MGVPMMMRILRRLFPLPAAYAEAGKSLEELSPEYCKWKWFFLLLLFLFSAPLALVWWWILDQAGILIASHFSDAVFQLRMSRIAWIVPAMPLGMLTSALPLTLFSHWCLKERYSEYIRYECLEKSTTLRRQPFLRISFFRDYFCWFYCRYFTGGRSSRRMRW